MAGTSDWDIVSAHSAYLLAKARRLTRNEADARDLLQETLLRALEGLRRTRESPANMRAWLHVVMRRQWLNTIRQKNSRARTPTVLVDDTIDSSLLDTRATFEQIERAWKQLPENAQGIAEECIISEEPYDMVSDRIGVTKATIATSIYRTRLQLKGLMFGR